MMFREIIAIHCKNHTKTQNISCGENLELPNAKAHVIYSNNHVLNG
jgi:hypothetical protein